MLNTVFITLAYCSALPLLLPFSFIAMFVMYWVEKFTLLRFYGKPPKMGEDFAHLVLKLLPWALLLHLAFSVWMYGDAEGLVSRPVNLHKDAWTQTYNDGLTTFSKYDRIHLTPKLRREIVFPNAALFVVLVVLRLCWSYVFAPLAHVLGCVPACSSVALLIIGHSQETACVAAVLLQPCGVPGVVPVPV